MFLLVRDFCCSLWDFLFSLSEYFSASDDFLTLSLLVAARLWYQLTSHMLSITHFDLVLPCFPPH